MGYSTQQEKVLVADPNFVPSLAERLATINQKDQLGPDDCVLIEGEWLHTLLSQVSDYIFIKDAHCRFVMANQQVCLDVGYENTEDIIGKTDLELHSPEIGRVIWEGEKTLLRFKKPIIDLAEMLVLPDGSRKWFSTSKYPILDCNGAVAGLIGIARDMTERRRSEYLHIGQNQILQMIATGTTLDSILTSLVGVFEDQLVSTVCAVMLVDEMEQLQWAAGPNLPDSLRVAADGVEVGPDTVSMGQALHLRKTVFSDDMTQEQGWRADIKPVLESGLRSNLTVPFFAKDGSALGVFTLFSSKSEPPSEHRRGLAEEEERLAAIAV